MSAVTIETLDYALKATRHQWLKALEAGEFDRAQRIGKRLDELLDQRCNATT